MAHASSYSGAQRTAVAHAPRQELRCLQWNRFSQVATQAAAVTEATRSGKPRNPAAGKDRLARWEDAIAANQRELLHRTMRNTQRLQSRLLDLDLDTDADTTDLSAALNEDAERANSGSSASTSHSYPARRRAVSAPVVPPSPEVLMALLRQTQAKRSRLEELDVRSPRAGTLCLHTRCPNTPTATPRVSLPSAPSGTHPPRLPRRPPPLTNYAPVHPPCSLLPAPCSYPGP